MCVYGPKRPGGWDAEQRGKQSSKQDGTPMRGLLGSARQAYSAATGGRRADGRVGWRGGAMGGSKHNSDFRSHMRFTTTGRRGRGDREGGLGWAEQDSGSVAID